MSSTSEAGTESHLEGASSRRRRSPPPARFPHQRGPTTIESIEEILVTFPTNSGFRVLETDEGKFPFDSDPNAGI
jgi:hypothetical protein